MAVWSEVSLSKIEHNRVDSEFYRPEFIYIDKKLSTFNNTFLKNISKKIDVGHVGSMVQHYREKGISLIQTHQINEFFLDLNNCVQITSNFHKKLKKSQIKKGDILIARSGSFGKASIYLEEKIINSADIIIIDIEESIIKKGFLLAFLNSKYGSKQLIRFASGGVQGHVNLKILEDYIIPIFHASEQEYISKLVFKSYKLKNHSQTLYAQAQELLEKELGLDKLKFNKPLWHETMYGDLISSNRLDAQHYRGKYDVLFRTIKKNRWNYLKDINIYNCRGQQPVYIEDGDIDVINSQHIGKQHLDYKKFKKTTLQEFNSVQQAHVQFDDLLIYTTGAYIGNTNVYLSDKPALASNHVNILRLKGNIDAAYLAVVMQSKIGQFQTEKHSRGSAQAELYPNDIDKFIVPILSEGKQKEIGDLSRKSLQLKQNSFKMLEKAKQQVEDLIEQAAGGT